MKRRPLRGADEELDEEVRDAKNHRYEKKSRKPTMTREGIEMVASSSVAILVASDELIEEIESVDQADFVVSSTVL